MVRDLTKGSPTRLIVSFACTMLLASMMSYIYNFTDSLMVGRFVNSEALGAVSATSPFYLLVNNLAFATLSGVSIIIGQLFGARDHVGMRKTMANAIYLTAIIITVATVASVLLCRPILIAMDTPKELLDMSVTYLTIVFLAKPVSAPSWLLSGVFRSLGDTKTPVIIAIINGFGNVVFNFLFLVVFPMGIAGAALGTLCSAATGSIVYIIIFRKKMQVLHFSREEAVFSPAIIKRLLSIGVPLGLESSITAFSSLILQVAINGHGVAAVTGISMGGKIMSLFWILFGVFESALLAFNAQNIGAEQLDRAHRGVRNTLFMLFGVGAVFFAVALLGIDRYVYMAFVGNDAPILRHAHRYLLIQVAAFPFVAMLYTWRAGLKSFGSTVPTVVCGVIELIARITVSLFFAHDLNVLFFAGPIAWIGTSIYLAISYPIVARRTERHIAEHRAQKEAKAADAQAIKTCEA